MKKGKFEIYKDKKKEWRWRLKAVNGRIVAQGESYKKLSSILKIYNLLLDLNCKNTVMIRMEK